MSTLQYPPRYEAMTRIARNFLPDFPVHVVHRGNNRQRIFTCEGDILLFRRYLEEGAANLRISVHSYVFMTNHVHLLLTSPTAPGISKLVQCVARRYVGYFNSRYARTGTLWEGRFHSSIIGSDAYLLACHRYIENNPVRAAMVTSPEMYLWSSHRHHATGTDDALVTPHPVVLNLAQDPRVRRAAYRDLFGHSQRLEEIEEFRNACRLSRSLGFPEVARRRPGRPAKETRL
jgi:putative transposase